MLPHLLPLQLPSTPTATWSLTYLFALAYVDRSHAPEIVFVCAGASGGGGGGGGGGEDKGKGLQERDVAVQREGQGGRELGKGLRFGKIGRGGEELEKVMVRMTLLKR